MSTGGCEDRANAGYDLPDIMEREAYAAGFRAGQEAMRERAAIVCAEKVEREADYGGRFGGYGKFMGDKTGAECTAAIRALPLVEPDAEK